MNWKRRLVIAGGLAAALGACTTFKPIRALAPQLFGLTCSDDGLCVERPETFAAARQLRQDALGFVSKKFGELAEPPKSIFCSTGKCFGRFGNPQVRAQIVWGYGTIVVNQHGWHDFIVRHEFIHQWQVEKFGLLNASMNLPRWYIEGMAYEMSGDPRRPLPHAEAEELRSKFVQWVEQGNDWRVPPP